MGSIFGGGDGRSKTTSDATLPPELRPLAKSAAGEIERTQQALPLASFASPQPRQIAGLSPFQVAGMQLVPGTVQPSAAEQSLFGQQGMWNNLIDTAINFQPSPVTTQASNYLMSLIGQQGVNAGAPISSFLPQGVGSAPSGLTAPPSLPQNLLGTGPVPMPAINEAVPTMPITPLMPTAPIAPPSAAPAAAAPMDPRTMIPPDRQPYYDHLIRIGIPPTTALEAAWNPAVRNGGDTVVGGMP